MTALLLKDYYVIFRQMKIFLLLILVFSCIPGTFYSTFAVVYASMLPYTALAYDERSRWDQMAAMMPYSARDVVLSKYLFGWIAVAVSAAATFVLQTILSVIWLSDVEGPSIPVILLSVCVAVCILDITLPMMFRFGVEKGRLVMFLIMFLCAKCARNKLNTAFTRLQVLSAAFMATSHGMNDAQKTMGVITLALFIFNEIETIAVPLWVKCLCATFMALGTAMGGWKIVKTMGHKIFKLEPVHGFASETSAALVISGASLLGAPISTTHTITACIFGVGSTKRLTAVRWGVAGHLIIAWVLTIPASGLLAACSFFLLNAVGFA